MFAFKYCCYKSEAPCCPSCLNSPFGPLLPWGMVGVSAWPLNYLAVLHFMSQPSHPGWCVCFILLLWNVTVACSLRSFKIQSKGCFLSSLSSHCCPFMFPAFGFQWLPQGWAHSDTLKCFLSVWLPQLWLVGAAGPASWLLESISLCGGKSCWFLEVPVHCIPVTSVPGQAADSE